MVELVRSESFDRLVEKINASPDELLESINLDEARADYRLGGCARAAGVENGGRPDRGESNHRARLRCQQALRALMLLRTHPPYLSPPLPLNDPWRCTDPPALRLLGCIRAPPYGSDVGFVHDDLRHRQQAQFIHDPVRHSGHLTELNAIDRQVITGEAMSITPLVFKRAELPERP
jgi:hypothetical protein